MDTAAFKVGAPRGNLERRSEGRFFLRKHLPCLTRTYVHKHLRGDWARRRLAANTFECVVDAADTPCEAHQDEDGDGAYLSVR